MIGYYAHSHGSGHCNYAQIFSKILMDKIIVFTDSDYNFNSSAKVVRLPNENPDGTQFDRNDFKEPSSLHYAPVNMRKITSRNLKILNTVLQEKVRLLIIDVSVEVAMLARVSSIPYAYVRLQGLRNDLPHMNAFQGATFLLAYFPKEMEYDSTPEWVKKKTIYLGFLSKYLFNTLPIPKPSQYICNGRPNLLYLSGFGGSKQIDFNSIQTLYNIYSVGPGRVCDACSIYAHIGVVECTRAFIAHADFIVAGCGSNTTSEILSLGKRFVAIAENRPYGEQKMMARRLEDMGWAVELPENASLEEALAKLRRIRYYPLPKITHEIELFCSLLTDAKFRADKLVNAFKEFKSQSCVYPKKGMGSKFILS